MKAFLTFIIQFADTLNEWAGKLVSWLTLILVFFVCFNVICRKFYDSSDAWRGELEWHIFALVFILGAGYAFKYNRHVRVDLFYAKYSDIDKAWTNLVGILVFLIPWCLLIIYYSWDFAIEGYNLKETSPNANGLSYLYPIKFAIPLGFSLLLLQAFGNLAKAICTLKGYPIKETPAIK